MAGKREWPGTDGIAAAREAARWRTVAGRLEIRTDCGDPGCDAVSLRREGMVLHIPAGEWAALRQAMTGG